MDAKEFLDSMDLKTNGDLLLYLKENGIEQLLETYASQQMPSNEEIIIYFNNHFRHYINNNNEGTPLPAFTRSDLLYFMEWLKSLQPKQEKEGE